MQRLVQFQCNTHGRTVGANQLCHKTHCHNSITLSVTLTLGPTRRARNNWVSGCPGHPKMMTETQFFDQGFRLETQVLSGRWTSLNLGFLTGNPLIAGEIQILRQVFRTETQILIVFSSPDHATIDLHP